MKMVHGGDDGKGVSPLKTRSGAGKKEAEHNEVRLSFQHLRNKFENDVQFRMNGPVRAC